VLAFRLELMPKVSLYKIAHVIQGKTTRLSKNIALCSEGPAGGGLGGFSVDRGPQSRLERDRARQEAGDGTAADWQK
jgi:hypothetical protein